MSRLTVLVAAAFLAAPVPIGAQQPPARTAAGESRGGEVRDNDEGNPRLGLLGLLGLAGLLGLFRREPDIHFDARRDK